MRPDISTRPNGKFGWLGGAVFGLDRWLRRWHGIFEFTGKDVCLFRLQSGRAEEKVMLSDGLEIKRTAPVLDLHLWNEHVPLMNGQGATVRWARRFNQALNFSLCELSRFLAEHPEFDDIVAIRGDLRFTLGSQDDQLARISERYGFERGAVTESKCALPRIGENIPMSLLALAINPRTAYKSIFRRGRQLAYPLRGNSEKRYVRRGAPRRRIGVRPC